MGNKKRRVRSPKAKPGQLVAKWGKVDGTEDVCYAWGEGVSKCDGHLLHNVISSPRHIVFDDSWTLSFVEELSLRGYDIKTLKFSVEKRSKPIIKLWIDDIRLPPDGWSWAKTSEEAISFIKNNLVVEISFDHDLGGDDTSIPVVKYIEEMAYEKSTHKIKWRVHSANPVGRKNIKDGMNSAERFWKKQTGEEDEVN